MEHLIKPHGGKLCDLMADEGRAEELRKASVDFKSHDLTQRQICDLELLMNGAFSPLTGFLNEEEYESVVDDMRLPDGTIWPMPVTLDVSADFAQSLTRGDKVALRDPEGFMLAVLTVESIWKPDKEAEAEKVFGTKDRKHPAVNYLFNEAGEYYVGGAIEGVHLPIHHDYADIRHTPTEVRQMFAKLGWRKVVAFQTRNPLHRAHKELTMRAAEQLDANILLHPVVGMTKPGDIDHYTRVRCYKAISKKYPPNMLMLSLLPLAMRMGGPREALWHAIIRKNYGCTHFIVGRDHAGPGNDSTGKPFYGPYDAQEMMKKYADELGIEMVPFKMMVYVKEKDSYYPIDEVPEGMETLNISGTELRERLRDGREIPEWFSYPEVVEELRKAHPPRSRQGFTLFFTGLSGSGKSTIANILLVKFLEMGGRPVTLLDGDIVRKNLSSELGFSKEHRDINILRIGFVANEITKNGGIAICAPIAPYEEIRRRNRELISANGGYIEIFVNTPIEICEQRDRKGLYAKARAGIIKGFTGIDDPYEPPENPEIILDTTELTPEEAANEVLLYLEREGYIR